MITHAQHLAHGVRSGYTPSCKDAHCEGPGQPALPGFPFSCGWNECGKDAVCALHSQEWGVTVNTCPEHFREVTGKEWLP